MPFALLIIGILLVVAAVRGTHQLLLTLVKQDFTGPANFLYWIGAIIIIGSIGYVSRLKPLSDGMLVIILLVLVLKTSRPDSPQGGFFQQLQTALNSSQSGAGTKVGIGPVSFNTGPTIGTTGPGRSGLNINIGV